MDAEQAILPLLRPTEIQRLNRISSHKKKREFLLSRALMRQALSELFDVPAKEWEFIEEVNAMPTINNLPKNAFISLSHSYGYIFFAVSAFAVGVDVELVREKKQLLEKASLFMSKKEIEGFKNLQGIDQLDSFYNIWCAKESYFKANKSNQKQMKFTSLSIIDDLENSSSWNLIAETINGVHYSVVVKNKANAIKLRGHN